jgi:hypothetical protein
MKPMSQDADDKIDIKDIARGRRITAVTAAELELVPRKGDRPKRPWMAARMWQKLKFRLESVKYEG